MRRFMRDLFMYSILEMELPYVVLYFSIILLLPFQIYLGMKVKNTKIKLLPAIFFTLATCYYSWLHLIGQHWDGVTYLVPAFLNTYLVFMCFVGLWCSEMIKKYGMSPMKRIMVIAVLEITLMIVLPWWGNKYASGDGVVPLFLAYYVINPVIFGISSFFAGKNTERFWIYPFMAVGMFLIGGWEAKLYSVIEMLPGYFSVAVVMLLIGRLMKRKK